MEKELWPELKGLMDECVKKACEVTGEDTARAGYMESMLNVLLDIV